MTGFYRRYDAAWNRVGYGATPQYSGQAKITHDFAEPVIAVVKHFATGEYLGKTADGRWIGVIPIKASLAA